MTKYISDVQTIEESGTTGIRVTVSEDAGDTTVTAVSEKEYNTIKSDIQQLKDTEITTDNLENELKKVNIDAKTLEGNPSSAFAKASDLANCELKLSYPLIGQIDGTDYSTITGLEDATMTPISSSNRGIVVVIPPNAYDSSKITSARVPINLEKDKVPGGSSDEDVMFTYIPMCTQVNLDGYGKCLVGRIDFKWEAGTSYDNTVLLTVNWAGRSTTRILGGKEANED